MKTVHLVTFLIVATLVFSAWVPSPVFAKAEATTTTLEADSVGANVDVASARIVKLAIINHTPATLFVTLIGRKTYFFSVTNRGTAKYEVEAGKYTYIISSSFCLGALSKKISVKNDSSIGPIVCHKNLKTSPWR